LEITRQQLGNNSAPSPSFGTVDTLGTHSDFNRQKQPARQPLAFSQQNTGKKATQKLVKKRQEMHPETGQKSAPSRRFILYKLVGTVCSVTLENSQCKKPQSTQGKKLNPNRIDYYQMTFL
jgi:hypothetical protein